MTQIVLAPVLLGGARPWAAALLSILTGIGILAICLTANPVKPRRYLGRIWLVVAALAAWSLLQSLPVWPMQDAPFNAPRIALYPNAWITMTGNLIWLAGSITLASMVAQSRPYRFARDIAKVIIASCALQVFLAVLAVILGLETTFWFAKHAHLSDWTGSFANRNAFAGFMGIGIVASLYLFTQNTARTTGKRLDQLGGMLALALIFAASLIQSHSRSGIVLGILASLVYVALNTSRNNVMKRLFWAGGTGVAMLLVFGLADQDLAGRFAELTRFDLIQRDDAWQTALHAIADRPITGFGAGSIALVMGHFATPGLNTNAHWFSSHNLWLDGAMMFGLPAVIALLVAGLLALKSILNNAITPSDRALTVSLIGFVLLGCLVGWVMSLPALILPIAVLWVGVSEAGLAQRGEGLERVDQMAQSRLPDQTSLR
ncbi:O-antigen ligase family protein [Thalassospira lucentensis]|uniref:O-antigen ligase family protein n=1 Tax=Thalassospira lucentensis TaxID=168935 RepID=UPI003D2F2302